MELSDFEKYVKRQLAKQVGQVSEEAAESPPAELPRYLLAGFSRNDRFGPFEIREQLGIGGFGLVFLARDTRADRLAALKLPLLQVLLTPQLRRKFESDGRTGGMFDHPGIVKVYEHGEVEGIPYIASEYVDGPNLETWLKQRKDSLPVDVAVDLAMRIADALSHAHSKGVVHRDLKPANILLRHAAGEASHTAIQPMITDFGLARVSGDIHPAAGASSGQAMIGSVLYMAPEQITGPKGAVGPASDIYALGVILYRMLTGTLPFPGLTSEAIIRKIVYDQADPVRSRRSAVPVDLETICEKCLRKKPQRRFASAADLRDDLRRFRDGDRIQARPIPRWEKAANWCRRYPTAAVAMLAAVIIIGQQAYQVRELRRVNADLNLANQLAKVNADNSRKSELEANSQKRLVQRFYYDRRLLDAQAAIADGNDLLAQQILTAIDSGPADREFVWNHLWRQSRVKIEYLPIADGDEGFAWIADPGVGPLLAAVAKSGKFQIIDTRTWRIAGEIANQNFRDGGGLEAYCTTDGGRLHAVWPLKSPYASPEPGAILRMASWDTAAGRFVSDRQFPVAVAGMLRTAFRAGSDLCLIANANLPAAAAKTHLLSYDFRTGELSQPALPEGLAIMRFSPDGRLMAAYHAPDEVKVWNTADFSREAFRLRLPEGLLPHDMTFYEGGSKIAAVQQAGDRVISWNLKGGVAGPTLPEAVYPVSNAGLNWIWGLEEGGGLIAADASTRMGRIDLAAQRFELFTFDPADPGANSQYDDSIHHDFEMVRTDGRLYIGRNQKGIGARGIVWEIATGRQIVMPAWIRDDLHVWKSRKPGQLYGASNQALLAWWPKRQFTLPDALAGHEDEAWCSAFTPDGSVILTGSDDYNEPRTLKAWDRKTGKALWGVKAHKGTVAAMALHPGGKRVATGALCKSGNVRIWDVATGQMTADLKGLDFHVRAVKFSTDGNRLAAGDNKGRCVVWDLASGQIVLELTAGVERVLCMAFLDDGRNLATGTEDGWIRVWNMADGAKIRETFIGARAQGLAIDQEMQSAAVIGFDKRLFFLDLASGKRRQFEMSGQEPWAVSLFPDGITLAAGDKQGNVVMWDLETGTEKFRTKAHNAKINALTLSPDGKTLISCAHDGTVKLWYAGEEL